MTQDTFGSRLRRAREKAGKTQKDIAEIFGMSREAVTQWESETGNLPSADKLVKLSLAVNTTVDYLLRGGKHVGTVAETPTAEGESNVDVGPPGDARQVPLISWRRAQQLEENPVLAASDAEVWFQVPSNVQSGPRTYCLTVEGDSMVSSFGKSYPRGCIVLVDPDVRSPIHGKRVIAMLERTQQLTFKQLALEDGRMFLRPLNPQYPPIFEPFSIMGTVVGKWEGED